MLLLFLATDLEQNVKKKKVSFETKNVLDLFLYYISSSLFFYD